MIDNAGKLLVFENFETDQSLPKFRRKDDHLDPVSYTLVQNSMFSVRNIQNSGSIVLQSQSTSWIERMALRFRLVRMIGVSRVLRWLFEKPQQTERMSVEQFFSSVCNSTRELELVSDRAVGYEQAMIRARKAGQRALLEQLVDGLNAYKMETQLVAIGMPRYLLEEDVVRFYKQSERGLRLDWVKNFVRQIPQEVLDRKIRADEIGIFDNYVVLHYDPKAKSWAETQEEKNRRKDPILFGLMSGRRRLYFVGDWKDEMCDLTLDQIADVLGKDVVKDATSEEIR